MIYLKEGFFIGDIKNLLQMNPYIKYMDYIDKVLRLYDIQMIYSKRQILRLPLNLTPLL